MSTKNSIQVGIKMRPLLRKDKDLSPCWRIMDNAIQLVESHAEPYCFDYIFDEDANNHVIFDKMAKNIVHSGVRGFNGTIFAYGQTSSGKTYTMIGDDENPGVMVLAATEIFKEIENTTDRQFLLRVGYIEIYNEKIYDLLNKKNQDLKIHETATGISVNCEEIIVTSEADLLHHLYLGNKERTVGETNMNERSSRSHAIFRIIIESRKMERCDDDAVIQSVLNLVDLAGSERADQTGARGARLKEGGHINKSLLFLSNVIKKLSENEEDKYISFRDSKLTRILQASLGGNALTSIICTIKPTAVDETQSTLSFAMRAKSIKNKPHVNEIVSDATMMKRLECKIKHLERRLDEERQKNESQTKVGQLEQRIKNEVLKIISCNSLHNIRTKKEKRRYTWCSETASLDVSMQSSIHTAPLQHSGKATRSQLPRAFTPHITLRTCAEERPQNIPQAAIICTNIAEEFEEVEEGFRPAELCKFEMSPKESAHLSWDNCKTPQPENLRPLSLTPVLKGNMAKNLKHVEHDLMELQEYAHLENKMEVKHDIYDALKQQLETVSERNTILELERLKHIESANELELTKQNLSDSEKRSDELEIQISKVTNLNQIANTKITKYEEELADLKTTIERLKLENRDVVSLEFEFERHKNKSRLRETELVEALAEKNQEISKLQKSLNVVTEEKLQCSKEELQQLSRGELIAENGNVCIKCEDLSRLLDENRKVISEFEKLTLEFEQLQLNYKQMANSATITQEKLVEFEQMQTTDKEACDKLRTEISSLCGRLEKVQWEYTQLQTDNTAKAELCHKLNSAVDTAWEDMRRLQGKYDKLEADWQAQQKTMIELQSDYNTLQPKYQNLIVEYETLKRVSGESVEDYERLQSENTQLQAEIKELKVRVEETQKMWSEAQADDKVIDDLRQQNEKLMKDFSVLQQQLQDIQTENDQLSSQLMDSIEEGENLKKHITELEERLRQLKECETRKEEVNEQPENFAEVKHMLETEISSLKAQLQVLLEDGQNGMEKPLGSVSALNGLECYTDDSLRSSGVSMEADTCSSTGSDLLQQFLRLSDKVQHIELEVEAGKSRLFIAKNANITNSAGYKLFLKNIQELKTYDQKDLNGYGNLVCMQGIISQQMFHIIELETKSVLKEMQTQGFNYECEDNENLDVAIEKLQIQVRELTAKNKFLCEENRSIVDSTQHTIAELRDEISKLSSELFEKSQCVEYLEKERAEITLVFEELQVKVKENNSNSMALYEDVDTTPNVTRESIGKDAHDTLCGDDEFPEDAPIAAKVKECDGDSMAKESNGEVCEDDKPVEHTGNYGGDLVKAPVVEIQTSSKLIEELRRQCAQLEKHSLAADASVAAMQAEYDQKLNDAKTTLESVKSALESKEKAYQKECSRLQLEFYEKLECNENEFRENLRKCNTEWENSRLSYENTISSLENRLESQSAAFKSDTDALQVELMSKSKELLEKIDDIKKYEAMLQDKGTQIEDLWKRIEFLAKEKADIFDSITAQSQELQEKVVILKNFEIELEDKRSEIDALSKRVQVITNENIAILSSKPEQSKALQEKTEIIKKYETELEEKSALNQELLQRIELLTKEKSDIEERRPERSEELQAQIETVSKYELELEEKGEQIKDLLQRVTDLAKEKAEILETKQEAEEEYFESYINLKMLYQQCMGEVRDVKATRSSLSEGGAKEQELDNSGKGGILSKLEDMFKKLVEEISHLKSPVKELEENSLKLISLRDELICEKHKLEEEISAARSDSDKKIDEKNQQIASLQGKLRASEKTLAENENLKETVDSLLSNCRSCIQSLQHEKESLLAELNDYKQAKLNAYEIEEELRSLVTTHVQSIEDLNWKISEMEAELGANKKELNAVIEGKNATLKNFEEQISGLDKLLKEKEKVQESFDSLKSEYENTIRSLQEEKHRLMVSIDEQKAEKSSMLDKEETMLLKVQSLTQELDERNKKNADFEELLNKLAEQQILYAVAIEEKIKLVEEVENLELALKATHERLENNSENAETQNFLIQTLQEELRLARLEVAAAQQREEFSQLQMKKLSATVSNEKAALQHENIELSSFIAEVHLRGDKLQETNLELQITNERLKKQLKEVSEKNAQAEDMLVELDTLRAQNNDLHMRMEATVDEANKRSKALEQDVTHHQNLLKQQIEVYNNLHTLMTTKEATLKLEVKKLDGTISCLLLEKKGLEDKLDATETMLKKAESELRTIQTKSLNSNHSIDSNNSFSPNRRSAERVENQISSTNRSLEDKRTAMQQKSLQLETVERKNRRLSTHDEHRRQSGNFFRASRDVACLTDPSDMNCKCVELDGKLKECETNLFIRTSQVAALNMELKNHPLKAENAGLMKRLEEEQNRQRLEIQKYKKKLTDQMMMEKVPRKPLAVHANTQTDSELEQILNKLQGKYNELKNVCSHRYNFIKELQEKIEIKENEDGNIAMSSLEAGQLKALKTEIESLKRELRVVKKKYEDAKVILLSRRNEIERLRQELSTGENEPGQAAI